MNVLVLNAESKLYQIKVEYHEIDWIAGISDKEQGDWESGVLILDSVGAQLIQQHLFFAAGNVNDGAVGHHKIATLSFDVFVNFIYVNQVGIMHTEKRVFFQHFFYLF